MSIIESSFANPGYHTIHGPGSNGQDTAGTGDLIRTRNSQAYLKEHFWNPGEGYRTTTGDPDEIVCVRPALAPWMPNAQLVYADRPSVHTKDENPQVFNVFDTGTFAHGLLYTRALLTTARVLDTQSQPHERTVAVCNSASALWRPEMPVTRSQVPDHFQVGNVALPSGDRCEFRTDRAHTPNATNERALTKSDKYGAPFLNEVNKSVTKYAQEHGVSLPTAVRRNVAPYGYMFLMEPSATDEEVAHTLCANFAAYKKAWRQMAGSEQPRIARHHELYEKKRATRLPDMPPMTTVPADEPAFSLYILLPATDEERAHFGLAVAVSPTIHPTPGFGGVENMYHVIKREPDPNHPVFDPPAELTEQVYEALRTQVQSPSYYRGD